MLSKNQFRKEYSSKKARLLLLALQFFCAGKGFCTDRGIEVGVGPAAVEEGDDRFRPAAMGHFGYKEYFGRFYGYGRTFGPVRERTWMLSAHRRFGMFGTSWLNVALGGVVMDEYTELKFDSRSEENTSAHSLNFGAVAGLHVQVTAVSPIYMEFGWDSHLFLAGPNGGLFLANGRKQTLSFGLGVRL